MSFLYKILNLVLKIIKLTIFLLIAILLLPKILLSYILVLYTIIISPPDYEQKGSKAEAVYEVLEMPINQVKELYQQCMNKKIINKDIEKSKAEKFLVRGIVCAIGVILFIGPILNMYISGYYILNRENILQKNIQLRQAIEEIKKEFRDYGEINNLNSIEINDYERKIDKTEGFLFECQNEPKKVKELCFDIMRKYGFLFVDEINKDEKKVLIFKKDGYISEIHFAENKKVKVILRRYDFFRESKLYDVLSPIILITSPLNPLRRFEVFKFSW